MPEESLREAALRYHRLSPPGKLRIQATKALASQRDLALAYSPGVAAACEEIAATPGEAANLTARGNLVAVITNGTAVLGLGAIGPLAAKPVMEGKSVLFKKFADIDAFDIEVNERDPDKLVEIVAALEPTFGGINLEDIKAPDCFTIERKLRDRLSIPVFHDDQHGTAIVTAAAVRNGLRLVNKEFNSVKLVVSGAGAAAIACVDLLVALGVKKANIVLIDSHGVVHSERTDLDDQKARYAVRTDARTLNDVMDGVDIFLGLSAPGVLTAEMVERMAPDPLILALANPVPEIMPEIAHAARPDAIIATGRSDYPNQVNNVLCFPFMFRGALDVGASAINEEMKLACVNAIADIATVEVSDVVASVYEGQHLNFGRDYILPKPFDPRLVVAIAPAVAQAAMDSGVATRPLEDIRAYQHSLTRIVFRSGNVMKPVIDAARQAPQRVIYTEAENERVLRAVQELIDENTVQPVLVGREDTIRQQLRDLGLRCGIGTDIEVIDPSHFAELEKLGDDYYALMSRRGVQHEAARAAVRNNPTILGAMLLRRGYVDALISGPLGGFHEHLHHIQNIIGLQRNVVVPAGMQLLILDRGTFFIADTSVNDDPDAEMVAEITALAAREVARFGIKPRVALLSHSNFGSRNTPDTMKLRIALDLLHHRVPDLEVDGEMQTDVALSESVRQRVLPESSLRGDANLLIMPNLDAANISFNALKVIGQGVSVGPIILGLNKPAHILSRSVTARGIVNLSAYAVTQAQSGNKAAQDTA